MTDHVVAPATPHGIVVWIVTTAVLPAYERLMPLTVTEPPAMTAVRVVDPRTADAPVRTKPAGGVIRTEPSCLLCQ